MIAKDVLVYKKRYGEKDWEMFLKDVESSAAQSANAAESRLGDEGAADILSVFRGMIDRVPDEKRLISSEEFIKKVRRFSRKYRVSAEIYRKSAMISAHLYFNADVLAEDRKEDFVKLMAEADELSGVPYPEGEQGPYDYMVILNYMTHHSFSDGREIHPFK
ncbi:MAG: hypothetical protein K6G56_03555 [Clostridiales bacterium]|nr:hypothetical protein [Clostridiales bacterium]